jgi:hypothetical protein
VIHLILFLLLGAGLLVLLFLIARRARPVAGSAQSVREAKQALSALQEWALPSSVLERVFAKQDMAYIMSSTPPDVQRLFVQERRKVAFLWVCQVHKSVGLLKNFHLSQARFHERLRLVTEIELGFSFAALLFACRVLQVALYAGGGSSAAPWMIGKTAEAVTRLCQVSEKSLEFLSPGREKAIVDGPASGKFPA